MAKKAKRARVPKKKYAKRRRSARNLSDPAYIAWRKAVYSRDEYKCQWPKCTHKFAALNAHHIRKWASEPSLRFVVNNGITLCHHHHDSIHGKEEEFERFFISLLSNAIAAKIRKLKDEQKKISDN